MILRPLAKGDEAELRRIHATSQVALWWTPRKVGFTRVGIMRRSERDADGGGWHDSLLMEGAGRRGE